MVKKSLISAFKNYVTVISPKAKQPIKVNSFWLRDHCRCKKCYNQSTHQLTSNLQKLLSHSHPLEMKTVDDVLNVVWDDGHISKYSLTWLSDVLLNIKVKKCNKVLWDKATIQSHTADTNITFSEYLEKDGKKRLLNIILSKGFCILTGVEPSVEATERAVTHLAPVMKTLFGTMWDVSNDLFHEDFAYTNISLEAHNDNTYWNEAAGLQVFHMLSHKGEGGETLLVDGFNAASNLKNKEPEAFDILCNTPVEAEYIENGVHYLAIDPIIKLDPTTKEMLQIRYNIRDRAVLNTIPQSEVGRFYEAYKLFGSEINNKTNEFWLKLHPGCVIFIDNWRVLHGRASYTGKRHLCGCYISRTEWMSKARALRLL